MSFREKFQSFVDEHFSTSAADEPTPGDGAEVETPVVEPEVPETTAPEGEPVIDASAQLAHLQEQLAASHKTAASAFVETEIQAGRMLPYEREQMTSMFIQAATDDTALPLASGSRVASLKAVQAARKPHGFNEEKIDANSTEKFILGLNSERSQMQKDADAQVSGYVATNYPKEAARLEVVK